MNEKFEEILDKCIDSINKGESIDECLASHPEHAGELLPLLKTVASAHKATQFTPSVEKKQAARQQLIAAMGGVEPVYIEKRPLLGQHIRQDKGMGKRNGNGDYGTNSSFRHNATA
mgnify:CR=1 FL=1